MARPREPLAKAKLTGATVAHASRYADRKEPKVKPIGNPPKHLDAVQLECWAMFADEMPWLGKADRVILELASRLRARMMTEGEFGVSAIAQLRMCLQSMGGTPTDRQKVPVTEDEKDDLSDFLN